MTFKKPFYVSPNGGSILCLDNTGERIYRACSSNHCTYTPDLHTAKSFLDTIENNQAKLLPSKNKEEKVPAQRKTTLKWNADGSLSSIDMARILARLGKGTLTECELSCGWGANPESINK